MSEAVRRLTDRVLTAVVLPRADGRRELEEAFVEMTTAGMFAVEVVGPMLTDGMSEEEARVYLTALARKANAVAREILTEQQATVLKLGTGGCERGSS